MNVSLSKNIVYLLAALIIGAISIYDNYMTVIYSRSLRTMEQNPIGYWIMGVGGLYSFVAIKSLTTMIAVFICIELAYTKYRMAIPYVLLSQILLFCHLNFSGASVHDVNTPITDAIRFYNFPESFDVDPYPIKKGILLKNSP